SSAYSVTLPPPRGSTLFPYTTLFRSRFLGHPRTFRDAPRERCAARRLVIARPPAWPPAARTARARCSRSVRRSGSRSRRSTWSRSEEHTSELQSRENLVCRLLLEKKK